MTNKEQEHSVMVAVSLQEDMQIFKALADETRLRILALLTHGELCVCDIMEVLKIPQSTASRHLAYLKNSKWVFGTRRGKWMYYQIDTNISDSSVHFLILQYLADHEEMREDHQALVSHLEKKHEGSCD